METDTFGLELITRLKQLVSQSPAFLDFAAAYTGAAHSTIRAHWLRQRRPPKGESLVRLWYLLNLAQSTTELDQLPEFNLRLGQLLTLAVITLEDAQLICGGVHPHAVYEIAWGRRRPAQPLMGLTELREKYGVELEAALAKFQQDLAQVLVPSAPVPAPIPAKPVVADTEDGPAAGLPMEPPEPAPPDFDTNLPLLELAGNLTGLVPLLRFALSDRITPAQRASLREQLIGEEQLMELINALAALKSERIRNQYLGR